MPAQWQFTCKKYDRKKKQTEVDQPMHNILEVEMM